MSTYLILDLWVQVDSLKQSIYRDPVGSRYVSHRRIAAFDNNLDYCFTVLENAKQGIEARNFAFDVT